VRLTQGFHHLAMEVKDFDKSVDFYTRVLGFEKGPAFGSNERRVILLDAGNSNYLELFEGGKGHAGDGAVVHIAFKTDDCDAAIEKVRSYGCEITTEPKDVDLPSDPVYPVRLAFFKGPDDEIVELFQER